MAQSDIDKIISENTPRLRSFVRGKVSNRDDADDNDDPDIRMLRSMVWQEFDNALGELPEEQRLAFVMTEIEGLSTKDAAEKTGIGTNTLLSRKHYAAIHIRKRLHALYNELTKS